MQIEWSEAMLTGVAEIDRQHRVVVDTLIEARTKLTGDAAQPLFEQITRDLLAAIYHFAAEERLMQQHGYASAAPEEAGKHLAAHRRFSEQVISLRAAARGGEKGSKDNLLAFLQCWLLDHIMTTDKRLGRFIGTIKPL